MPIVLDGSQGISTPMYAGSITSNPVTPSVNMKNRIINGNMTIDQRNAGASVTPTNDAYTLDRWQVNISDNSKFTIQQSSTAPAGFKNSLLVTSSSAFSLAAGSYFVLDQKIEGFNTADLNFGTANAQTVTLSFWVRSSLTGTFGGVLRNSAENRSYPFTYTISSANTFEYKTVTVAGDTSGTWIGATNGVGLYVGFGLGVGATYSGTAGAWAGATYASATGATSVVSTNGATWYITGVQLEVGSTATSFDYRNYTTELQLCQRYLPAFNSANTFDYVGFGFTTGTTNAQMTFQYYVPPRVAPTGVTNSTASNFLFYYGPASHTVSAFTFVGGGSRMSIMNCTISGGPAGGTSGVLFANSATAQLLFTGCEL